MIERALNFINSFLKSKIPFAAYLKIKRNRNRAGKCVINNTTFGFTNGNVFIALYKHIFIEEIYNFSTNPDGNFLILDCGANIGMATLYFKKTYPNARIIAYEPDKKTFEVLQNNATFNKLTNVSLNEKAIWINNNGVTFDDTNNLTSKIGTQNKATKLIQSQRLFDILTAEVKVDFLKLDIEGAELAVIEDCKELLYKVDKMFIEYHSNPKEQQKLQNILTALTDQGFRYYIKEDCNISNNPFHKINPVWGYDLQLQIFAYK
jgi:FkbM family methyltransferase